MVCSNNGTIFIAGDWEDTLTFMDTTLVSNGRTDCYIAQIDTTGVRRSTIAFGDLNTDRIFAITLQSDGMLSATGYFQKTLHIGDTTVDAPVYEAFYLAAFNPDASLKWLRTSDAFCGKALISTASGLTAVAGQFTRGTATFTEGDTLVSRGNSDIFLTLYDKNGAVRWSVAAGGKSDDYATTVACSRNEELYLLGSFADTLFIEDSIIAADGSAELAFIAKFDTTGTLLWKKPLLSSSSVYASSVITDSAGNLYVTGSFKSSLTIDTLTINGDNEFDFFLAKLTPNGTPLWVTHSQLGFGSDLAAGPENSLFVSGNFKSNTTFGDFRVKSHDIEDIFLANFAPDGTCNWVTTAGGCRSANCNVLAADDHSLIIAGSIDKTGCVHACPIQMGQLEELFEIESEGATLLAMLDYTREPERIKVPHTLLPHFSTSYYQEKTVYDLMGRHLPQPLAGHKQGCASQIIISKHPAGRQTVQKSTAHVK